MRSFFSILLVAALLLPTAKVQADTHFAVISDLHVAVGNHSQEIFDTAIAKISAEQPDILLISGDLTDRGDADAHLYVSSQLKTLSETGMQVYVIPGNHDLYGTAATPEEFESYYAAFGYGHSVLRHDESLSYLAYPNSTVALLCLDSTRPADDQGKHSDGGITASLLTWAEEAAEMAKADGRIVIGMMHHQMMEHFDQQARVAENYVANTDVDYYPALDIVQQRLIDAGVHVMLTGHFHIQSIQHVLTESGELHDVSTGSLANYSSPIRSLSLSSDGLLSISSEQIDLYRDEQLERNAQIVSTIFAQGASTLYPMMDQIKDAIPSSFLGLLRFPSSEEEMLGDMKDYMFTPVLDIYNALAAGDEDQNDPDALYNACYEGLQDYILYICKGNQMLANMLVEGISNSEDLDENYLELFDSVLKSIVYNYRDVLENVVADNELQIQLPAPPTSTIGLKKNDIPSQRFSIDGKRIGAADFYPISISNQQVRTDCK